MLQKAHFYGLSRRILFTGSINITTSPGVVKTERGMSEDFIWTLSEPFDHTSVTAFFNVSQGYTAEGEVILTYYFGGEDDCQRISSSVSCITNGTEIGFSISDIKTDNASIYSLYVMFNSTIPDEDSNQDALLYLYGKYIIRCIW